MFKPRYTGGYRSYPSGHFSGATLYGYQYDALLLSEGHYKLKTGAWSGGGPFYCVHNSLLNTGGRIIPKAIYGGTTHLHYHLNGIAGAISTVRPSWATVSSAPTWATTESSLKADLTTGFTRTRPGNPVASLGQFLIELRDLPDPGLAASGAGLKISRMKDRLKQFVTLEQNIGSQYLNAVFGWLPFVKDLREIYNLTQNIDKALGKIIRENNKPITRRATLENSVTTSTTHTVANNPFAHVLGGPPVPMSGISVLDVTSKTTRRGWYVGKYRYYIPDTNSLQWRRRATAALFGVLPTPSLLYSVMPFSWLTDYFFNIGQIMSNLSQNAVDNLVNIYTYAMRNEIIETESHVYANWSGNYNPPNFVWDGGSCTVSVSKRNEIKARQGGANPFGFSVKLKDLSSYQLAILAALGMSRSKLSF